MNYSYWYAPNPQAGQQVYYCRECGQFHPLQQANFPRQLAPQPNFQQPEMQPNFRQPGPGFQQPEMQTNFQEPELQSNLQQLEPEPNLREPEQQPEQQSSEWSRQINLVEAINIALEQVPGEAVEAELEENGASGRPYYEVDIISEQGVKYEVEIDANSGEVLTVELD